MREPTMFHWNLAYLGWEIPWDRLSPSCELIRVVNNGQVTPGRVFELGCGTGTNAVYLAKRGFSVTAVDWSTVALARARTRAAAESVNVTFLEADLCNFSADPAPFDFVFDRGCYDATRRVNLPGFMATVRRITRPGSKYLLLAGGADDPAGREPLPVRERDLRADWETDFSLDWLHPLGWAKPDGIKGLFDWSCLMTRRGATGPDQEGRNCHTQAT